MTITVGRKENERSVSLPLDLRVAGNPILRNAMLPEEQELPSMQMINKPALKGSSSLIINEMKNQGTVA